MCVYYGSCCRDFYTICPRKSQCGKLNFHCIQAVFNTFSWKHPLLLVCSAQFLEGTRLKKPRRWISPRPSDPLRTRSHPRPLPPPTPPHPTPRPPLTPTQRPAAGGLSMPSCSWRTGRSTPLEVKPGRPKECEVTVCCCLLNSKFFLTNKSPDFNMRRHRSDLQLNKKLKLWWL